jgi:hypothetical protein
MQALQKEHGGIVRKQNVVSVLRRAQALGIGSVSRCACSSCEDQSGLLTVVVKSDVRLLAASETDCVFAMLRGDFVAWCRSDGCAVS